MEPQPQESGTPTSDGKGELITIQVDGIGPDGTTYHSEIDLLFPKGMRITSVSATPTAPPQGK